MAFTSRPTAASAEKAIEVFGTVELMETILLHLDTVDVLKAMQATRSMRDTVNGSIQVQKSIGLLPNYDVDFKPLLWRTLGEDSSTRFHGLGLRNHHETYCSSYDNRYDDVQCGLIPDPRELPEADFIFTANTGTSIYKLGSSCRNLSICQPPVTSMSIYSLCSHCEGNWIGFIHEIPNYEGKVTPRNGEYVTLGGLYSALVQTRTAHRSKCKKPKAKADIRVEFRGSVKLGSEDPIMLLRQNREYAKEHYSFWDWDRSRRRM